MFRHRTLENLHEELNTIAVFDRIHEYCAEPDSAEKSAYAARQARREQIIAEISQLRRAQGIPGRVAGAFLLVYGAGHAAVQLLFR